MFKFQIKGDFWQEFEDFLHIIFDETRAKLYKKKAPKEVREKETRGKDQSPSKQTAQKRWATRW